MSKSKVIGLAVTGLAVVGGLALFNYFKKPKETRGGFLSMDGRRKAPVRANCGKRNTDGSYSYYYDLDGECNSGYKTVAYFGDRNI